MRILNGWKEIAAHLNRTPRSARRWERLGLPMQRVSESGRSPVMAFSDEIESWLRSRGMKLREVGSLEANHAARKKTRCRTLELVDELRAAGIAQQRLLEAIRESSRGGGIFLSGASSGV
jgi:hypothetical protein